MSNTINGEWTRGNKATPGNPAKGYTYIDFQWNQPADDNNHDLIISPTIEVPFRGDIITFLITMGQPQYHQLRNQHQKEYL